MGYPLAMHSFFICCSPFEILVVVMARIMRTV